jgi:TetR/AcrR family transcriptional regulator
MAKLREKRERLSGEERKAQIIDAALKFFSDKGFTGTRTKEIADFLGISETLIYLHFKSKEVLYRESLRTLFGRHPVMPDIEQKMAEKDDFAVFGELARHVIRHNREDRRMLRLAIFCALEGFPLAEIVHRDDEVGPPLPTLLSRYIQQRISDEVFRDINAEIVAQLFVDLIYTCVLDKEAAISGPPIPYSDDEIVEIMVGVFVQGLKK